MENPQPSANLNYCLVCVQFRGRMWVAFNDLYHYWLRYGPSLWKHSPKL